MSRTHVYIEDPVLPPDHNGRGSCASCGLPERNDHHDHPSTTKAQAAVLARYDKDVVPPS